MSQIVAILKQCPVIPVIVIDQIEHALPLAETLVTAGFTTLEITLRTKIAYKAIELLTIKIPQASIGAGTIVNTQQLIDVKNSGAQFAVSPGLNQQLVVCAKQQNLPYLPGVVTASEALLAHELTLTAVKFFPTEAMGGIKTIRSLSEVFPELLFCPTGGVTLENVNNYLALSCVPCVGGTWLVPQQAIREKNWLAIETLAQQTINVLKRKNHT